MLLSKVPLVVRQIFHADVPNPLKHVRHAYGADGAQHDAGVNCLEFETEDGEVVATPSLTRQADAEDCDINVMLAKYQKTGEPPRVNSRQAQYGDFSSVPQFQEALAIVEQARADFSELPAAVRERFGNDPAGMLAFLSNPANKDEAVRLGLVVPPTVVAAPSEPPKSASPA